MHLRAGDILVTVNGEYVVLEKVQHELLEAPVTVYNFQVEDYHTYFVGESGIRVHNANCHGVGGKGWVGDKTWRNNVKAVARGGTITNLNGLVPTRSEAEALIREAGGIILRAEGPHDSPNPHNFWHINYITAEGLRGTIRIQG